MSALLSLPLLSYLVIPSLGTYSTSLNVLFFYLTWATLVLSHPPLKVELVGTLAIRVLLFVIPSTLFLFFDALLPSLSVRIKSQGEAALPVRSASGAFKRQRALAWWKVVAVSLGNILLGLALQAGVESLSAATLHRSALKVTTTLPSPWKLLKDVTKGFLTREVLQYYLHRYVLHSETSTAVGRLAAQHKSWHHSIRAPHSFVANYDHPIAWTLWRFIPTYIPAVLFHFHLLTYFVFLSLVSFEETFAFSGYSTVPSILLGGIAKRQDIHSKSTGAGNFGPWGLCDWAHGTNEGGFLGDDMREELEKHDVPEKAQGAVDSARAVATRKKRSKS
ncbi:MAG: hypothetical protein M1825_004147 [Sarcosagium campestre]|nr:MAG: hypothetical protein M1825_004147 [Sarcosagium campestre]